MYTTALTLLLTASICDDSYSFSVENKASGSTGQYRLNFFGWDFDFESFQWLQFLLEKFSVKTSSKILAQYGHDRSIFLMHDL